MPTPANLLKLSPTAVFKYLWSAPELATQDWLAWDPHALLATIGASGVSELEQDKVLAAQHVGYNTAEVCSSVQAFYSVCSAFNNEHYITDGVLPLHVEEIVYAVKHICDIAGIVHNSTNIEFTGEVPGYVASCAKYHGWVLLPQSLSFAQDMLDHLTGVFANPDKVEHNKAVLADTVEFIKTITPSNIPVDILTSDTAETIMRRKIIGATLYDPTLLVKGPATT